jgi:hypothetical protein
MLINTLIKWYLGGFGTNYIFFGNVEIFKKNKSQREYFVKKKEDIFCDIME